MRIDIHQLARALELKILSDTDQPMRSFESSDQNRPGLQFAGYYEIFAYERMQIVGKTEMAYLDTLDLKVRTERLEAFFSWDVPCIVICRDIGCPLEMAQIARRRNVPVLGSDEQTTRFQARALAYLNKMLAPRERIHGVMMDINGVGVLLTGNSGVGKSEAALELIKRGHQLVADDAVELMRVSEDQLVAEAPESIRHYMEIRGIGIIDISAMFGVASVTPSKGIDLVIHLENWEASRDYDRLGIREETTSLLGVEIPQVLLPVRPGRNLAVVIEVAARNWRLHRLGYNAAQTLNDRLIEQAAAAFAGRSDP